MPMFSVLNHTFTPTMSPPPVNGPDRIVFQAEDCEAFVTKEGELPGGDRAAVWLSGDGAGLKDMTILGTPQVNIGLALRSAEPTGWVSGIVVKNVKVLDIDGKQAENCAIQAHNVLRTTCRRMRAMGPHAALPLRGPTVRVPAGTN